jgi:hypothetical protein
MGVLIPNESKLSEDKRDQLRALGTVEDSSTETSPRRQFREVDARDSNQGGFGAKGFSSISPSFTIQDVKGAGPTVAVEYELRTARRSHNHRHTTGRREACC